MRKGCPAFAAAARCNRQFLLCCSALISGLIFTTSVLQNIQSTISALSSGTIQLDPTFAPSSIQHYSRLNASHHLYLAITSTHICIYRPLKRVNVICVPSLIRKINLLKGLTASFIPANATIIINAPAAIFIARAARIVHPYISAAWR